MKEVKQRDAKISDLENQNQALDKQAADLSNSITNLNVQIAETQEKAGDIRGQQVISGEGAAAHDYGKGGAQRQINDITVLKAQVAKLREDLNIARRIESIRNGLFASSEQKGANG